MDTPNSTGGSSEPIPVSFNPSESEPSTAVGAAPGIGTAGEPTKVTVQSVPPPDVPPLPRTAGISEVQHKALAVLASGAGPTAAARAAGVDFSTVYRWRKEDPAFIAALNAWRNHAQESARDRVLAMAGQAMETVLAAMQKGDARTAMAILKGLGAIAPASQGPESVIGVRRAMDRDNYREYINVQRERIEQRDECAIIIHRGTGRTLLQEDKEPPQNHAAAEK